jgi:hypothetical protein
MKKILCLTLALAVATVFAGAVVAADEKAPAAAAPAVVEKKAEPAADNTAPAVEKKAEAAPAEKK